MSVCPIFAQWKIPATVHNWKILETERFLIHYPEGLETTALKSAEMGENAAMRYEKLFNHRLTKQIPVFLYASPQDFAQTNVLPFPLDESTGGFTDFYRRRVVLPFQGDYAVLRHVLDHELVHAFQFDVLGGERLGSYPLWLMEGMAEYLSLGWDQSAENFVRDAVLNDRMPDLIQLHNEQVQNGYAYYKAGQAVMLFIAERYGPERIAFFLKILRNENSLDRASRAAFNLSPEELNIEFGKFIRARYSKAIAAYAKEKDERLREATNRYQSHTGFQLHPAVSPDGTKLAYLTVDGIFPAIVIRPVPGPGILKRRQEDKRLVLRALRSKDYEEVQILTTRLSFTPDGKSLLVAGRREGHASLLFFDEETGDLKESYSPAFDSIGFPAISPDGKTVAFTGLVFGKTDLYTLSRPSGKVTRITNDLFAESTPVFAANGNSLYYSSNATKDLEKPGANIFRYSLTGGQVTQISNLPGTNDTPVSYTDGSIVFRSTQNGVSNAYKIENADSLNAAATTDIPITRSPTGVFYFARAGDGLVFTEQIEGAHEIRVLGKITGTDRLESGLLTFDTQGTFPLSSLIRSPKILSTGGDYSPFLSIQGIPFVFITVGAGPDNKTSTAAIAFVSVADDSGDHQLSTMVSYNQNPVETNFNLEYAYLKYRTDFFAGVYHQTGTFAIFNFFDFSLNNLLYNPYFRVLDQRSSGLYGGVEYPLHSFGSVSAVFNAGREERIFQTERPEERPQKDIFQNHQSLGLGYTYDNVIYSQYGPLDGHSFGLQYSLPVQLRSDDRQLNILTSQLVFHHLFDGFSSISMRLFAGRASGRDADLYPFQIGGVQSLRGYRFLEFEGRNAFLLNLEYRFNFIEYLQFGVPVSWSPGLIRGALFFDAGSAFDRYQDFQGYSRKYGVTRDLHLSFGVGIHWANFLWFLVPGALMKIEWATPYDTKRSLPLSKWKGNLSIGFKF
ncbi:MAG: BamA/TamA family outer membrane protein [Spirochaetia bacterium]|nr:BamA/TamA family outer membrane protein [Spirochaetia bacterium]